MEDRAEIYKEMKSQIQEDRIKRKKEKIKQIIREKRMIQAQQIQPTISEKEKAQEVVEVKMEEAEEKGFKSCTKTKKKWRSRKKCWCCGSSHHFKKHCPKIRCFSCHRLGHMKAQCFMKQIKQILQWMGKTIKKKEEKKKIKRKKKIERKEKLEIQKLPEKTNRFHHTRREKDTKMEWSSN